MVSTGAAEKLQLAHGILRDEMVKMRSVNILQILGIASSENTRPKRSTNTLSETGHLDAIYY